ncbi:outer membrane beta-barrel protein [Aequorivita marisscotiae]|uniref:Outer membrane beta-barrel protein n=1 Tax=Aequorivita marisscotiae TaxID=3040348 RepID=A0ABY8KWB0_9FLAO|nr:outer membrane beta-barrel protein [Aequorivita sp. Ant34-E75]WGF93690.1 outer membrane beta-barrel protein [Aequorivita sp. Ant34-E75]
MKEKKNIDNIFNEGFKNFEATPSPRVWENIQAELQKEKKDRKVIPLWIKFGGVAALIALLLTVGNSLYNSSNTAPSITNENVNEVENSFEKNKSEIENFYKTPQVASEEKIIERKAVETENASKSNISEKGTDAKSSNKVFKNNAEKSNRSVIASDDSKENSNKNAIQKNTSINNLEEGIATSKNISEKVKADNISDKTHENIIRKDDPIFDSKTENLAVNKPPKKDSSEESIVKTEAQLAEENKNKKSIFEAIAEQDEEIISEKKINQKPERRWNIAPNVAPVYYSSLGNGSSIDPTFGDNPQDGDVNMSYGVQVSYALNNRLSVRTGINNVDLSYSTGGIEIGSGPVALALRTVDYGGREIVLTAVDKGALANAAPSNGFGEIMPKSTKGEARLIQNINYYEVPVELKYAVINSKFGLNLIGGISTLFLGNNEVSVKADNFNSVLGEANNLSALSFSTNVGLGVDYKLSKKFTFNIEPMFKYQLNPYTDSSVDFKPYYLGVYSGLSFKF